MGVPTALLEGRFRRSGLRRPLRGLPQRRQADGYHPLPMRAAVIRQPLTVTEARENLAEALTLYFERASVDEAERRQREEVYVTQIEIEVG